MKSRLDDARRQPGGGASGSRTAPRGYEDPDDGAASAPPPPASSLSPVEQRSREQFLQRVEQVKQILNTIDHNIDEMDRLHGQKLTCTTHEKAKKLNDELQVFLTQTNAEIKRAQDILKQLDAENTAFKGGSGEKRMRESQFAMLVRTLAAKTRRVQESEGEALMRYRTRLKEEIHIADPTASEEKVEQYLNAGQSQVFADMLFSNSATAHTIKTTYEMAVEKYRDLLQLEQSLEELHELFVDFSNLTFQQGAAVDQIAANIEKADNYVAQGTQALYDARKHQKKARKLMCCSMM